MALEAALGVATVVVAALLALEGAYFLWATAASRRPPPLPKAASMERPPPVAIQVPVKDEGDVLDRALHAIARLDWPREAIEVQLIDDSNADGRAANAKRLDGLAAAGIPVAHLAGDPRDHKAGALRVALDATRAEVIAILDADFAPPPDWLRRVVPILLADEGLACIQSRWSTRNTRASWASGPVALALDAHFLVEQRARAHQGALLSFVGTGAVWRRDAIERAGGWSGRTLAEDVDLGILALLDGRRFALAEEPPVEQEVPASVGAFRTQQARWARGSMQNARLHAGRVARERSLPRGVRAETLVHLTHYAFHPLLFALFLLTLARPWTPDVAVGSARWLLFGALVGGAAPFVAATMRLREPARLAHLALLTLLGLGISWSNTRAVFAGLFGSRGAFVRTPKGGDRGRRTLRWGELALGAAGVAGSVALAAGGWWAASAGSAAFATGFLTVAIAR